MDVIRDGIVYTMRGNRISNVTFLRTKDGKDRIVVGQYQPKRLRKALNEIAIPKDVVIAVEADEVVVYAGSSTGERYANRLRKFLSTNQNQEEEADADQK